MHPSPARTLSRADVVALGRAGRPWQFLPVAAGALAIAPADHEVRFLAAAAWATLGFVSRARDLLSQLPASVPEVAALAEALSGLPNDVVSPEQVVATCRRNLAAAAGRLHGVHPATIAGWEQAAAGSRWLRGLDGLAVRDAAHWFPPDPGLCADARAWAASLRNAENQFCQPCVIEGLSPPWGLLEAWNATREAVLGHTPRITVVQAGATDLLDALGARDLSGVLADDRVEIFAGAGAGERLSAALSERGAVRLPRMAYATPGLCARTEPPLMTRLGDAVKAQEAEHHRLRARAAGVYAGRDTRWWAGRFAGASRGGLRVLVPVSRYSTFVRHFASDLAGAFDRAGHSARVLEEPDDHAQLASVAYLREFDAFEPDLVVVLNHPRRSLGAPIPDGVPYICWLQDAMPHLFDGATGAGAGELDFWVGHLFREMFERFGCRADRALPAPVVASPVKFHAGPVAAAARGRLTCEVACVSHHSETPAAMQDRLITEIANAAPALAPALPRIASGALALAENCAARPLHRELGTLVEQGLTQTLGRAPEARTLSLVLRSFALPLADRALRHATLEWASGICRSRGWRLRLYGRGWDTHPTLALWAAGEVSHGEELRAAYQCAAAHLHVSATSIIHQRAVECFLSGGVCLPRVHADALSGVSAAVLDGLIGLPPDATDAQGRAGYDPARHADLRRLADLKGGFGAPLPAGPVWVRREKVEGLRAWRWAHTPEQDPDRAYAGLREVGFATREQLDAILARAVGDREWRRATNLRVAGHMARHFTHDAFVPRLITLVAQGLGAARRPAEAA